MREAPPGILGADHRRYAVPPIGGEADVVVPTLTGPLREVVRRATVLGKVRTFHLPRRWMVTSNRPELCVQWRIVLVQVEGEGRPRSIAIERFPEVDLAEPEANAL